jgi:hypothetical protein
VTVQLSRDHPVAWAVAISTIRMLERRMLWMVSTAVFLFLLLLEPSARAGMFASV